MGKIADVVKLKTGYANFVNLKIAFEEGQENADRMAMYRPTKSHREAFERICRGLFYPNDKKFYLLSGSYGTGKSHLCLMLANFLSRSSGAPEIAGFYDNYARLDPEQAKILKNIRRDGQYLVAICDCYTGHRFEDVVMKAVFEACESRGLSTVETEFDEAVRQLDQWKERGGEGVRNFYQDFHHTLDSIFPGMTVEQLRSGLEKYESAYLENFRAVFKEMMGGIEFQAQPGNLISVIKKLVRREEFKERFKGLAIFYDEFGSTLERNLYTKDILQGFMETICKNEPNVMFAGCIHKNFEAYADRLSKDDAAVMRARLTQVDLLNEGIEEIIGAIVETDKDSEVWKNKVAPRTGVFDQLVPPSKSLNLFPWIEDVERIRRRVLEDIYGVHPMALACLLRLSSEVGSDVRSTFTFFSGDVGGEKGSYADFVKDADIVVDGGKLNLYTVDQLFSFFEDELSLKSSELREGQRQFVNGYYASLDALRKTTEGTLFGLETTDHRVKALRTILIYQLCQIPATLENIQFGLYALSQAEKNLVKNLLGELVKSGALFFRRQSKTYELAISAGEDPYALIDRYVENPELYPPDLVKAFSEEACGRQTTRFAEAKGYNLPFSEDKRFRIRFVQSKDIGNALWEEIRTEQDAGVKPSEGFEGTLVYALCEDEAEVNRAREAAKEIVDENVLLAVPHRPQPFTETLLRVKACRYYLPPNEPINISAQTESRLQDILTDQKDGYLTVLKRIYESIAGGSEACWYGQGGQILVDQPKQPHQPADMLCEKLFPKRCRIKHADLNYCHDDRWLVGRNAALKQAIAVLLEAERVLIDNGNPESHGERRYLEKVLLKGAGAFNKVAAEGTVAYFHCEADPGLIHDDFPVLKELCEQLDKQGAEGVPAAVFCDDVRKAPYGAGGTQLILSLAHVIRAYGERMIAYEDSTKMSEQPVRSYENLVELVSNPAAQTVFVVRDISPAQMKFVDLAAEAINAPPLKHGEIRTVQSFFEALKHWWVELPDVAKIMDLHEGRHRQHLGELKSLIDRSMSGVDRFNFILEQLPAIYFGSRVATFSEEDAVTTGKAFANDVKLLNTGEQIAHKKMAGAICELFETKGDFVECERAVIEWYKNLNPIQRDPSKCDHEEASRFLGRLNDHSTNFKKKMVDLLPNDYGFGAVSEWTALHIEGFIAKLKQAKAEIERVKTIVDKPSVEEGEHELSVAEKMMVGLSEGTAKLIYTLDGSDPRGSQSAKESNKPLDISSFLEGQPNVKIRIRAVDHEGNTSDPVTIDLISKERKYEIRVGEDFLGNKVVTFRHPEDTNGLVAALKSIIKYAEVKKLLDAEIAEEIEELLPDAD